MGYCGWGFQFLEIVPLARGVGENLLGLTV